eukprot:TRINITY_DN26208_c0_g1_i1.p1 TRINITY_DN26208_c0_g1~~TRINITY_DN26208_c0_g1_i1.p1  ORF type:complete len:159 (-),score=46.73 TRINITY_DN26208_c0_g1_i1:158-589(-)
MAVGVLLKDPREAARGAALQRHGLGAPSGGHRLGGGENGLHLLASPSQMAADAAERRRREDDLWCPVEQAKQGVVVSAQGGFDEDEVVIIRKRPFEGVSERKEERAPKRREVEGWSCHQCTLINDLHSKSCVLCEAPNSTSIV